MNTRLACPRCEQDAMTKSHLRLATLSSAACGVVNIFLRKHEQKHN